MTPHPGRELPSLEVWPDCRCPMCNQALQLVGFCGGCGWDEAAEPVAEEAA